MDARMIVFDLDGTLTEGISWARLNVALGVSSEEDERLRRAYLAGEFTMEEWLNFIKEVFIRNGNPTEQIIRTIAQDYTFFPGVRKAVKCAKARYEHVGIISGAFDLAVEAVAKDLDMDFGFGNAAFHFDDRGLLQHIQPKGEDSRIKAVHLANLCESLDIALQDCVCVGDSSNDREIFIATGRGVTFSHCTDLHDCCSMQVKDHFELAEVFAKT